MVAMALIVAVCSVSAADIYVKKANKEAKQMKSGKKEPAWMVAPGDQPLEMQLAKSYRMKDEMTDDGEEKWIMAEAMSVGENYDGAKMQALTLAIQQLAQKIQTSVAAEIKSAGGNKQLGADDAATALETVMGSTQWITNTIGKVTTVVECYQILPNKSRNVRVVIAYNEKRAKEGAKKALREELSKEGSEISDKLDKLLGF